MDNKPLPVKTMAIVATSSGNKVLVPLSVIGTSALGSGSAPGKNTLTIAIQASTSSATAPPAVSSGGGAASSPASTHLTTTSGITKVRDSSGAIHLKLPMNPANTSRSLRTRTVVINANKVVATSPQAISAHPKINVATSILSPTTTSITSGTVENTLVIDLPSQRSESIPTPPPPPLHTPLQIPATTSSDALSSPADSSLPTLTPAVCPSPVPMVEENFEVVNKQTNGSPSFDEKSHCAVDFDPLNVVIWDEGIGTLPGSDVKFKLDDDGTLTVVDDEEAEQIRESHRHKILNGESLIVPADGSPISPEEPEKDETSEPIDKDLLTCANCGNKGPSKSFIRAGKFCSRECAAYQASQLRALTKAPGTLSLDNAKSILDHQNKANLVSLSAASSPVSEPRGQKNKKMDESSKMPNDANYEANLRSAYNSFFMEELGKIDIMSKKKHKSSPRRENVNGLIPPSNSLVNISPESALHQSIFSLRMIQNHQHNSPIGWEKHSKNLKNYTSDLNAKDVLTWDPERVAQFVNSIPGCQDLGQTFLDEMVDGEAFLLLNQIDIVKILNIKLGPAVKIHNSILLIRDSIDV